MLNKFVELVLSNCQIESLLEGNGNLNFIWASIWNFKFAVEKLLIAHEREAKL